MNETSLARSIDKLGRRKAEDLLRSMASAVNSALQPYWRHKDAGDELHLEDIKNVLIEYAELLGKDKIYKTKPTDKLVSSCRAKILDDLLKGLPKLNEIAAMAAQEQADDHHQE